MIAKPWQNLSVRKQLLMKGNCARRSHTAKARQPPRLNVKIDPEAQQSGAEDHAGAKVGPKAEDRSKQNEANDNVQRKLVVMNRPEVFPVPIPQRSPPVNAIVEEEQDQGPTGIASCHAFGYARC